MEAWLRLCFFSLCYILAAVTPFPLFYSFSSWKELKFDFWRESFDSLIGAQTKQFAGAKLACFCENSSILWDALSSF